jgi:RNA polymerase sigma factor (TIGR02999 family)
MASDPADSDTALASSASTDVLFVAVYDRLKAMAGNRLAASPGGPRGRTLDTTELVHELYLRVGKDLEFAHPAKFFSYAASAMRHLLADRARNRLRFKAGGDWVKITLPDDGGDIAVDSAEQALALDSAVSRLAEIDARAATVVELRYYAGLTLEQIADAMGVVRRTIDRDWLFARAFLKAELAP